MGIHIFRRELASISILPHITSSCLIAALLFFRHFISCEFTVVNPTAYVQPLLCCVLQVATSCRIREMNCPLLFILRTEYYKQCLVHTPSVPSFSLSLHL